MLANGQLASGSSDKKINIWNVETGQAVKSISARSQVYSLAQLSNGNLASGLYDATIKIWYIVNKKAGLMKTLTGHTGQVTACLSLSNGNLASASSDKTVRI
jgi:WD40 repeat protein